MAKKLRIEAVLDATGVLVGAEAVEGALDGIKQAAALAILTMGAAGLGAAFRASVAEAKKSEEAYKRVEVRIHALNRSYQTLAPEIRRTVEAQSALANVADLEIIDTFNRLLTTTGDYEQSLEGLPLALDIVASGMADVGGAASIMTRILSGSTRELKQFNGLAEAMDRYESKEDRARAGLQFVKGRVGGTAAAVAGDTLSGAEAGFRESVTDFQRAIGEQFAPAVEDFYKASEFILRGGQDYLLGAMKLENNPQVAALLMLLDKAFGILPEPPRPIEGPPAPPLWGRPPPTGSYLQEGFVGPPRPPMSNWEYARWDLPLVGIRGDRRGVTSGDRLGPGADFGPPVPIENEDYWEKFRDRYQKEMDDANDQLANRMGNIFGSAISTAFDQGGAAGVKALGRMLRDMLIKELSMRLATALIPGGQGFGLAKAIGK